MQKKLDETKHHYDEVTEKLKNASQEEREALEKKRVELEEKMKKMEENITKKIETEAAATKERKEKEADEGKKEEKPLIPEKKEHPEVKIAVVAKSLEILLGNSKVQTVIGQHRETSMEEILAQYDPSTKQAKESIEQWYKPPENSSGDEREEYKIGAQQLIELCGRNQYILLNEKIKTTDLKNITLGAFLEKIGGGLIMAHETLSAVEKHKEDLSKWDAHDLFTEQVKNGSISKNINESMRANMPETLKDVSLEEILTYLKDHALDAQFTVRYFLESNIPETDKTGQCIKHICEKGIDAKDIEPFFHEVLPNHEWDPNDQTQNLQIIRTFMMEMHVTDLIRLFSYKNMIRSGKETDVASGLTMSQAEILRFIRIKDKTLGGTLKPDSYKVAGSLLYKVMTNNTELQQMLEKLDIPPEMQEQAATMLTSVATKMGESGLLAASGIAREQASGILALWEENKLYGTILGVTGASILTRGLPKTLASPVQDPLKLYFWIARHNDPKKTAAALKHTASWKDASIGGLTRAGWAKWRYGAVGHHPRHRAGEKIDRILNSMNDVNEKQFSKIYADFERCLGQGGRPESFIEMQKSVEELIEVERAAGRPTANLEKVAERIKDFATNPDLQDAREALMLRQSPVSERLGLRGSTNPVKIENNINALLKDEDMLSLLSKAGVKAEDAEALLKLAQESGDVALDADAILMINRSAKAKAILAAAIETTDTSEVIRALKAARRARALPIALNLAGAATDMFGIYMAYADWMENEQKIIETKNPALKELYANAKPLYIAEGTASAAGLTIGGIAMVQAYVAGGSVLTVLAAPAAGIMLPIGLAVAGAGYTHRSLTDAAEGWLKTANDWEKNDNADLLKRIEELAPKSTTVGQKVVRVFEGSETVQTANNNQRDELYRAYFQKNTILPKRPEETKDQYKDRYQNFIYQELRYIRGITAGTYHIVSGKDLELAYTYAELQMKNRELEAKNQTEEVEVVDEKNHVTKQTLTSMITDNSVDTVLRNLHHYKEQQEQEEFTQMVLFANQIGKGQKTPAVETAVRNVVLTQLKHNINRFESRLRSADFSGIGDTEEQQLVRSFVKAMLDGRLHFILEAVLDTGTNLEKLQDGSIRKKFEEEMSYCRELLADDPILLHAQAKQSQSKFNLQDTGERSLLYLVPGTAEEQQRHGS